jgi:hypothetical protein
VIDAVGTLCHRLLSHFWSHLLLGVPMHTSNVCLKSLPLLSHFKLSQEPCSLTLQSQRHRPKVASYCPHAGDAQPLGHQLVDWCLSFLSSYLWVNYREIHSCVGFCFEIGSRFLPRLAWTTILLF